MRVLGAINLNSLCKCSVFDFAFSEELFSQDNFFGSRAILYCQVDIELPPLSVSVGIRVIETNCGSEFLPNGYDKSFRLIKFMSSS